MDSLGSLALGREFYAQRAWANAYGSLALADRSSSLAGDDLERLAVSAYLIGRDDDYLSALGRAYDVHLGRSEVRRAIRCAFWLGLRLLFRGETGQASGWFARAQRLLEGEPRDCAEWGYLLLTLTEQRLASGDPEAAHAAAAEAAKIGEACAEADLIAIARHDQGRIRIQQGRVSEGLTLLDEAMLAVTSGELSPIVTGLIYCSVIQACQEVYAWDRACEWTSALARWCAEQQQLIAFTGLCLVHRAEVLQLQGAWQDAIEEVRRACERCAQVANRNATAAAFYQAAEVYRLRGEFAAAEEAYRNASQWGWDPQPGFALLRLTQSQAEMAAAAIRRAVSMTTESLQRTKLLPACIEIMIAVGDLDEARNACGELERLAENFATGVLGAIAAQSRGMVELAEGEPEAALRSLQSAWEVWREAGAPYRAACVRALIGLACRALGDEDGAELEFDAAKVIFEQLGATPDLARVEALDLRASPARPHSLTPRELQVLHLIAAGKTNKAIASELFLSEKTVDRHVSNIFTKLNVPSRAAATAHAYEHKLI